MRPIAILYVLSLFLAVCPLHANSNTPVDLQKARLRYEAALTAASKPIQLKYLAELKKMLEKALAAKNLDLAVAINAEINTITVALDSSAESFKKRLINTTWVWYNNETITLNEDGSATWNMSTRPLTWAVADHKERVINGTTASGKVYKIVLNPGLESGAIFEGTDKTGRNTVVLPNKKKSGS